VTVIQEDKKQLALDSIVKIDQDEYKAKIGLQVIESSETSTTYKPELTYSGPNTEGKSMEYKVDGKEKILTSLSELLIIKMLSCRSDQEGQKW
jgi:hypothetical protein